MTTGVPLAELAACDWSVNKSGALTPTIYIPGSTRAAAPTCLPDRRPKIKVSAMDPLTHTHSACRRCCLFSGEGGERIRLG